MVSSSQRARLGGARKATHIFPTLAPGATLALEWVLGNSGGASGLAQASLSIFGVGLVAQGPQITVPVGAGTEPAPGLGVPVVSVPVSWTNNLAPGSYQAITWVLDVTPGADDSALKVEHLFSFTVPAPVVLKPKLFVVSGPRIV